MHQIFTTHAQKQSFKLYRVRFSIPSSKNNSRVTAEVFLKFFISERNIRATTSFINFCTWKRITDTYALYVVSKSNLRCRISNNEHLINGIKRKQKMWDRVSVQFRSEKFWQLCNFCLMKQKHSFWEKKKVYCKIFLLTKNNSLKKNRIFSLLLFVFQNAI